MFAHAGFGRCEMVHPRSFAFDIDNLGQQVRLFGYSRFAQPIVITQDPLLVRG